MKIGRNDPCFCGSGKKYKKCHYLNPIVPIEQNPNTSRSIKERNSILIQAIWDIFGFRKGKKWHDVRKEMSNEEVIELYKVIGWLWPIKTDIIPLLPKPDNKLRGFYMGETRPDLFAILKNILRQSLYTDEILVVNPFMNPRGIAPDYNPILHPELYKQDTLEMIYFILKLYPWIEAGIVNMIPNPVDFDYELRKSVWSMAEKRWKDQKLDLSPETLAEIKPRGIRMIEKTMYRLPKDKLEISLKKRLPDMNDKQLKEMVEYIQKLREQDQMILDQDLPEEGDLQIMRNGANLELGLYLAQLTGSYLYTDRTEQWQEILSSAQKPSSDGDVWSPLTKSFQSLEFNFLNDLDAKFALNLKEEGRLEKFRGFLRKVWADVNGTYSFEESNKHAKALSEELQEEYSKANEEWEQIDKDLLKWLTGTGGIATSISGGMNWQIPALGFCISAVGKLLVARTDRKNFKNTVPMSVFLDLKKKNKILK